MEAGDGYTRFGASGVDANIVAAWAPGSPPTVYPEDTGIIIEGSRKLVVQMHYYPGLEPKTDTTAIELRFADMVKYPARIGGSGDTDLALAPAQPAVTTAHSFQMVGEATNTVHGLFPHMHKRGQSLRLDVVNDEGRSCMLDVPSWDFDWQRLHLYETPLLIDKTEMLELTCGYDTSMAWTPSSTATAPTTRCASAQRQGIQRPT